MAVNISVSFPDDKAWLVEHIEAMAGQVPGSSRSAVILMLIEEALGERTRAQDESAERQQRIEAVVLRIEARLTNLHTAMPPTEANGAADRAAVDEIKGALLSL